MRQIHRAFSVGLILTASLVLAACDSSESRAKAFVEKTREQDAIARPLVDCMLSKLSARAARDIGVSDAERSTINPHDSFMSLPPVVRTKPDHELLVRNAAVQVATVGCGEPPLEWAAFPGPTSRDSDQYPEPDPVVEANRQLRRSAFLAFDTRLKDLPDYQQGYDDVMAPRIAEKRRADAKVAEMAQAADRREREWAVKGEGDSKAQGITPANR